MPRKTRSKTGSSETTKGSSAKGDKAAAPAAAATPEAPPAPSTDPIQDALIARARAEELAASNEEMRRQIEATKQHALALEAIKDSLSREVDDFQDHTWRRELAGELEKLKQQLAELQGDDEYDEIPDTVMGPELSQASQAAALVAAWQQLQAASLEDNIKMEEEAYPHEAVARMQANLEEELGVIVDHLQALKAQSTAVAVHKQQLERELNSIKDKQAAKAAPPPAATPAADALPAAPKAVLAGAEGGPSTNS